MRKKAGVLSLLLILSLLVSMPAKANSGPPEWNTGEDRGALLRGEKAPATVEKEDLSIGDFKREGDVYRGRVRAEYHYYNPTEERVRLELSFPETMSLEQAAKEETDFTVGGAPVSYTVYPAKKPFERIGEEPGFPELLKTKITEPSEKVWYKGRFPSESTLPLAENDRFFTIGEVTAMEKSRDGVRLTTHDGSDFILYSVKDPGGDATKIGLEDMTEEILEASEIGTPDDETKRIFALLLSDGEYDPLGNPVEALYRTPRVLFYDYEIELEPGERTIHTVDAPIFTSMKTDYKTTSQIINYSLEGILHFEKAGPVHLTLEGPEDLHPVYANFPVEDGEIDPYEYPDLIAEYSSEEGVSLLKEGAGITIWHVIPVVILLIIVALYVVRYLRRKDQQGQIEERLRRSKDRNAK